MEKKEKEHREHEHEGHKLARYMQNVDSNLRNGTPLNCLLEKKKEVK